MKVSGPLQSEEARGTIAGFLTFSKRKSGQQVRWQKKQSDRQSAGQVAQRAEFLNASLACRFYEFGVLSFGISLFGNEIGLYTSQAQNQPLTPYNVCIQEYLRA